LRAATPKKRKATKKQDSGWPETRYLEHDEFKQAKFDAYLIAASGYRWSIFVSLMPPDYLSDAGKQKWIRRKLGRLGQALERRGQPYISQTTLEKKRGGKLHGHALIYVLPENFDMIERHADKFLRVARKKLDGEISVEFHAEVIGATPDDLRNVILYSLKQHRFAGKYEESRKFWIKMGDPIKGRRLSYSKTALAILAKEKAKLPGAADNAPVVTPAAAAAPMSASISTSISAPVQLTMSFDVQPVVSPLQLVERVEERRIELKMTETEIARAFGMRQPHFNNVKHGRDRFGPWARRRAVEFLAATSSQRLAA
jgi:hypothetical protein